MKQYLDLVRDVLLNGEERGDRTGTGTISLFGTQTRYDLREGFPILTTKKVNFDAVKAELFWFLSGSTNINDLDSGIWNEWADQLGDLGPIYGHQWRNWGGEQGKLGTGRDQIAEAICDIKRNPNSRRIIVNAWNVDDVVEMALPACHVMFQFYVSQGKYLDCQLYQRSADLALGVPFNVASYALLMSLIANECCLQARHFVHTIGDAHIYKNHVEGIVRQLRRAPGNTPRLNFSRYLGFDQQIELGRDSVRLLGYNPQPAIKFEVSV